MRQLKAGCVVFDGVSSELLMVPGPMLTGAAGAAAVLGASGLVSWAVFNPASQIFSPVVRRLQDAGAVALTFDDGPTEPFTSRILDILGERGARASFFVVGCNVRKHPRLVARMIAEGHTVGNHTLDHDHFGIMHFRGYWRGQIGEAGRVIRDACGRTPALFRPPMGFKTWHMASVLRQYQLRVIGWTVRSLDTRLGAEQIRERLAPHLGGGTILALHDGLEPARRGASQEATVAALPGLLDALERRGMKAAALGDVLPGPFYT